MNLKPALTWFCDCSMLCLSLGIHRDDWWSVKSGADLGQTCEIDVAVKAFLDRSSVPQLCLISHRDAHFQWPNTSQEESVCLIVILCFNLVYNLWTFFCWHKALRRKSPYSALEKRAVICSEEKTPTTVTVKRSERVFYALLLPGKAVCVLQRAVLMCVSQALTNQKARKMTQAALWATELLKK